jgi:hypothetical protein
MAFTALAIGPGFFENGQAPNATAPAVPQDAVSLGLLQKAKKLAAQLGGIQTAKAAMDALSQLMD